MKTNYNDIDELLVKYLTGESSREEKTYVQQWLQQGEKNRQYYDHFRLIWEESLQLASTITVDEEAAWQRFQQRTQEAPKASIRVMPAMRFVRIAAAVIIVAGLAWMAWSLLSDSNEEITIARLQTNDNVQSDTLPDGSFITINKHSSLSYPEKFTGNTRNVQLSGEGFFKIKPNKQKPFIIDAGNNVTIEVLGTSFNVKQRGDSVEIIVEEGRVMVKYEGKSVLLKEGEMIVIKIGQAQAQKQPVGDPLHNYYRTHAFICNGTPLWKLVKSLNEIYGSNIIIDNPSLRTRPVTAKFEVDSLHKVLEPMSMALDFTIIKTDSAIILR